MERFSENFFWFFKLIKLILFNRISFSNVFVVLILESRREREKVFFGNLVLRGDFFRGWYWWGDLGVWLVFCFLFLFLIW